MQNKFLKGRKIAKQLKVRAAEADNQSLTPGTHMKEGENQFLQVFLHHHPPQKSHTHTHKLNVEKKLKSR